MKILCIGRNYVAHAQELNNEVPVEPVFFMKPDTALLLNNHSFPVPEWTHNVHHEIELVIRICKTGRKIPRESASGYFREIGLGIDFTARDVQDQLKNKGLPWEKSKAFDHSAVLGTAFIPKNELNDLKALGFCLDINGRTVQNGNSGLMIFSFEDIIAHLSRYITLKKGDLIYTGTPAGVGPVKAGDHLEGYLEDKKLFDFWIA
jgi:acylpyruvate hydrolase